MSDFDTAVQRLTAWVRDYGDSKAREFIGDVSMLLVAAKENYQLRRDIERQHKSLLECHRWACTKDDCKLDGGPEHDLAFKAEVGE